MFEQLAKVAARCLARPPRCTPWSPKVVRICAAVTLGSLLPDLGEGLPTPPGRLGPGPRAAGGGGAGRRAVKMPFVGTSQRAVLLLARSSLPRRWLVPVAPMRIEPIASGCMGLSELTCGHLPVDAVEKQELPDDVLSGPAGD